VRAWGDSTSFAKQRLGWRVVQLRSSAGVDTRGGPPESGRSSSSQRGPIVPPQARTEPEQLLASGGVLLPYHPGRHDAGHEDFPPAPGLGPCRQRKPRRLLAEYPTIPHGPVDRPLGPLQRHLGTMMVPRLIPGTDEPGRANGPPLLADRPRRRPERPPWPLRFAGRGAFDVAVPFPPLIQPPQVRAVPRPSQWQRNNLRTSVRCA